MSLSIQAQLFSMRHCFHRKQESFKDILRSSLKMLWTKCHVFNERTNFGTIKQLIRYFQTKELCHYQLLYARLQTGRIMVWWCPSVRPSALFLHFSHTCFDIMSWNFAHDFVLMYYRSRLSVVTLCQFLKELCRPTLRPSVRVSVRPFSALFSYMLWHTELKFCTWLCFNVLQLKFECRHFASIFEGVMPLCELRI